MQARHLALEGKELHVSQTSAQEKKAGLLLNFQPKISRISLWRAKGRAVGKKEKNELLLACTSCCCLLPAASPLLCQVLPYVICLHTEQREKVMSQVCHVWESAVCSWEPGGTQGESSHFCSCGVCGPWCLLVYSSRQLG